jgi:hypothetical protein
LDVALAICLGAYSLVATCFGLGLYALLQPSASRNPGLAAYEPPPGTVISYALPARLKDTPETDGRATASAETEQAEPAPTLNPPEHPTKDVARAERPKTEARVQAKPRRTVVRPREQRDPRWDYAAQPFGGNYRPWF